MTAAPSSPLSPREFRQAIGRYATGIAVVTTVHENERHGMTINSLTSVSLDPLLALFCCEQDASFHEPLLAAGSWAVSVLSVDQHDLAVWFATRGLSSAAQFGDVATRPGPVTGAPLLPNALAWFECRTWAVYDGGDHSIVVGEVLDLEVGSEEHPLLYYRSSYRTLGD